MSSRQSGRHVLLKKYRGVSIWVFHATKAVQKTRKLRVYISDNEFDEFSYTRNDAKTLERAISKAKKFIDSKI